MARTRPIDDLARARPDGVSLPGLLGQLVHAVAWALFRNLPARLVNGLIVTCALVALATPLLLWISWTKWGMVVVLSTGLGAIALCMLLVYLRPDDSF